MNEGMLFTETVNVLGTRYKIVFGDADEYPSLNHMDGYTDTSIYLIVVDDFKNLDADDAKKDILEYQKSILRHEILHAFLNESGLANNSNHTDNWAINEEMVDWFAIQSPKIFNAYKEVGCI